MAEVQLVVFQIRPGDGGPVQEFAVPITQVQEINRLTNPTKIPNAPDFVEGVINLRESIIPVIDLKKRFNIVKSGQSEDTRIIVVEVSGYTIGVIVDAVSEVLRINEEAIEPPPRFIAGIAHEYLTGVGKVGERLLILLDLDKVFSVEEKSQIATINDAG